MCNLVPRVSGFLVSGATPAHYMQKAKSSVMTTIIMGSSHLLPSMAFLIIFSDNMPHFLSVNDALDKCRKF